MTIDDHLAGLIRESIDLEISGKRFYEHAAEVTENEQGKKMFENLAKAEDGHMESAGRIFTQMLGNEDWREIAEQEAEKAPSSGIVDELKSAIDGWIGNKKKADDIEALRMAMELERRAIKFFENLAAKSDDPKVHELAEKLADEERFHYDMLQAQHDNIMNVGFWLDDPEFRMDGKF